MGTEVFFRLTMTVQAPAHAQRLRLPNGVHLVNAAVASDTSDAMIHMRAVVEVGMIWKMMHLDPLNRVAIPPAFADGNERGTLGFDTGMAVHTSLGRRQRSVACAFHRAVAVTAIHPQLVGVHRMAERYGLLGHVTYIRCFRGERHSDEYRQVQSTTQHQQY